MSGINFAAEDVDELGVFEEEFGRALAAGDAEFLVEVTHGAEVVEASEIAIDL